MRVAVLGPVVVENGPRLAGRERMVLAALVVSMGSVCPADRLAAAMYGDDLPATWRKVVQGTIVRLRRALGAAAIETTPDGYRLAIADDEVDLRRLERLLDRAKQLLGDGDYDRAVAEATEALALFRGEPLVELDGWPPGRAEAARIVELRHLGEDRLLDALLSIGRAAEAVAYGERLVGDEPLREQRWAALALAQYRAGRQGEALRSIRRARAVLADELGVSPGPDLERIEQQILAHSPELASSVAVLGVVSTACPYRGLAAYDIQDAELFFGRDRETAECLKRLRAVGFLAVVGPSGCGKSSLARAGVAATLAAAGQSVATITPGNEPERALADVDTSAGPYVPLLVDQLEELFTQCTDEGARQRFAAALVRRVASTPVLVTLRADHLAEVTRLGELAVWVERGIFLLGTLADDALRAAIVEPAARAGLRLEPGLVELAVRDVTGRPGSLPMLSHALAATWERREAGMLTSAGYEAGGGVNGAVATTAERVVAELSPAGLRVAHDLLLRLVLVDTSNEAVRRRLDRSDMPDDIESNQVLDALVRARLVTADEGTIEITHEAMVDAWPRLHDWLLEDREGQATMGHLARAASGWSASGRDDAELYRGSRLQRAEEWVHDTAPTLTAAEHEFLERSRLLHQNELDALAADARRQRVHNRRLRRLLGAVAMLLVVALVAGVVAVGQRRRATATERESALRAVIGDSLALRRSRRDLAALLAVEAYRLAPRPDTEAALFATFTAAPGVGRTVQLDLDLRGAALVLPDEKTMLFSDDHGGMHFVDIATGAEQSHIDGLAETVDSTYMSLSADGRYLAVSYDDTGNDDTGNSLAVWDLRTRQPRFRRVDLPIQSGSTEINGDGSLVAISGGIDARVLIYDGATGVLLRELGRIPRPADAAFRRNTARAIFTPDGTLIVGSQAGTIRFFDARTGREQRQIDGPSQTSEATLEISPDGRSLLTGGFNGLMLYDLASGAAKWLAPANVSCTGTAYAAVIGAYLCAVEGGRVVAVDLATGAVVGGKFDSQRGNAGLYMMPDGVTMLEFGIGLYTSWRLDGSGLLSHVLPIAGHVFGYTGDGTALIVGVSDDGRDVIQIVDATTGAIRDTIPGALDARPTADPSRLVTRFDDNTIGWYDLTKDVRVGTGVDPGFDFFDFAASGSRVVLWPFDGPLSVIDLDAGTVEALGEPQAHVYLAWMAGPDRLLTTAAAGGVTRRDPLTGGALAQYDPPVYTGAVAVGTDVVIASSPDGQLMVLDPDSLQPDGAPFASGRGHLAGAGLSADRRRLMVLGADSALRVFDVANRLQLGDDIEVHSTDGAAIRADGLQIAAASDHGIVVWDLDPQHWVAAACELAGRDLTHAEWDQYLGTLGSYRTTCDGL